MRQVSRCDMTARLDDDDDPPVFLMNHEMQNILDSDPKWSYKCIRQYLMYIYECVCGETIYIYI